MTTENRPPFWCGAPGCTQRHGHEQRTPHGILTDDGLIPSDAAALRLWREAQLDAATARADEVVRRAAQQLKSAMRDGNIEHDATEAARDEAWREVTRLEDRAERAHDLAVLAVHLPRPFRRPVAALMRRAERSYDRDAARIRRRLQESYR